MSPVAISAAAAVLLGLGILLGLALVAAAGRRAQADEDEHVAGALDLVRPPLDALSVARHTDEEW